MSFEVEFSCVSHIGNVRCMNQDNFICNGYYMDVNSSETKIPVTGLATNKQLILFGVFDGMGGEERGEQASYIAAKEAANMSKSKNHVYDLIAYCKKANDQICDYADNHNISSMGTTAAMLLFAKNKITLCNVGDTRIYRYSVGEVEQISKDHVVPAIYGKKPPLSQNLGIPPSELIIEPYISQGNYKDGDGYLICSDGLTDMVSMEEIKDILKEKQDKDIAEALLGKALQNGGKDNITVIWIRIRKVKRNFIKLFTKDDGGKNL